MTYGQGYDIYWQRVKWEKRTGRITVRIVEGDWGKGEPINSEIPKFIVLVKDHFVDQDFYPPKAENDLRLLKLQLDKDSWKLIVEAWKIKEKHNQENLKNIELNPYEATLFEGT